jgi:hypothetical protein
MERNAPDLPRPFQHDRVVGPGNHPIADGDRATKGTLAVGDAFPASFDGHSHQFGGIDHRYTYGWVGQSTPPTTNCRRALFAVPKKSLLIDYQK